jgi:hypothetical protein
LPAGRCQATGPYDDKPQSNAAVGSEGRQTLGNLKVGSCSLQALVKSDIVDNLDYVHGVHKITIHLKTVTM